MDITWKEQQFPHVTGSLQQESHSNHIFCLRSDKSDTNDSVSEHRKFSGRVYKSQFPTMDH
jgi:hypothetical protein